PAATAGDDVNCEPAGKTGRLSCRARAAVDLWRDRLVRRQVAARHSRGSGAGERVHERRVDGRSAQRGRDCDSRSPSSAARRQLISDTTDTKAMTEYIEIRGARENNLKDITLRIPKRQITIFTGVSGSGKSSIVFDTIATEAQRQLYENFSLFVRSFLPKYPPPEADAIENLSMAVIVDQKRLGGGSHSTVGTITDIYTLLRLLFSRVGRPQIGASNAFSFNDPAGMCRECGGLGRKMGVAWEGFIDKSKSLAEGAIQVPFWVPWEVAGYAAS